MEKILFEQLPVQGPPLYELRHLFRAGGQFTSVSISHVTLLPGQRVPAAGTSVHEEDEYSFFLEGEVYTESGDWKGLCGIGEGTLIPRGEAHWCENRTGKPCRLVCVMVK